jgi:hypothetical protein
MTDTLLNVNIGACLGDRIQSLYVALKHYDIENIEFWFMLKDSNSKLELPMYFPLDTYFKLHEKLKIHYYYKNSSLDFKEKNVINCVSKFPIIPAKDIIFSDYVKFNDYHENLLISFDTEIQNKIGIHIRAYEGGQYYRDKLDHLIQKTNEILNPNEKYFICSDSEYVINYYKTFKNVKVMEEYIYKNGFVDRFNKESEFHAVRDMFLLSKCKKIIKSLGGYAYAASLFNRTPFETLNLN